MQRSVLDDLGQEVTGISAPVSICMAITVILVRVLNPEGSSSNEVFRLATLYYDEKETDSSGQKLGGALLNAIIFVAVIGAMTFVLFFLFKYGCMRVIYAYMGFSVFNIFFFIMGLLTVNLLQVIDVHIDAFSLVFFLFNFSVVGVLGLFFWPMPLLLKQIYLVVVGIITAYIFTWIPEWTSWVLLVAMAVYDLFAVLMPGGPLKVLVELAIERQQELPALVYEARPSRGPYQRGRWGRRGQQGEQDPSGQASRTLLAPTTDIEPGLGSMAAASAAASSDYMEGRRAPGPIAEGIEESPLALPGSPSVQPLLNHVTTFSTSSSREVVDLGRTTDCQVGLTVTRCRQSSTNGQHSPSEPSGTPQAPQTYAPAAHNIDISNGGPGEGPVDGPGTPGAASSEVDMELPDGIKLGLGDFIFYSMLVGRAAMYDMMTVFSSFLAIIAGLGITLLLLALFQKALPALPVSIALGVLFYFLTRLALEPFVVPVVSNNMFF